MSHGAEPVGRDNDRRVAERTADSCSGRLVAVVRSVGCSESETGRTEGVEAWKHFRRRILCQRFVAKLADGQRVGDGLLVARLCRRAREIYQRFNAV